MYTFNSSNRKICFYSLSFKIVWYLCFEGNEDAGIDIPDDIHSLFNCGQKRSATTTGFHSFSRCDQKWSSLTSISGWCHQQHSSASVSTPIATTSFVAIKHRGPFSLKYNVKNCFPRWNCNHPFHHRMDIIQVLLQQQTNNERLTSSWGWSWNLKSSLLDNLHVLKYVCVWEYYNFMNWVLIKVNIIFNV